MGLELLTGNDKVIKSKCIVHVNNTVDVYEDFVALGFNNKAQVVEVRHNCDVLTIHLGLKILSQVMTEMYDKMPQAEKDIVDDYFAKERMVTN
jgi:hypothetical protein